MPTSALETAKSKSGIKITSLEKGKKIVFELEVIDQENCEATEVVALDYVNFGNKTSFAGVFKVNKMEII